MAQRARKHMADGVGSVRGLTVMIATEGIFVRYSTRPQARASIANNASKRCQHCRRAASKTWKVPKKLNRAYLRDRKSPQNGHSTESGYRYR